MSMDFTAERVLALYQQIQYGQTRQIKNEANQQIVLFLASQQAWVIATQLLTADRSQQDQFIGAQVIFKKIETHFDQIESKDAQILEVRNTLFQLLPATYGRKIVMDRLCMAIALLALKTSNTCWSSSIKDFIASGSTSAEQCFVCLLLLKHLTSMYETQCLDRRSKQIADSFIRENLTDVLGYLAQVLDQTGLPQECYYEALSASKCWCQFSTGTYVANQVFISCIFRLMQTDLFPKCVKVIKKLLTVSKFAKSLQHQKREEAIAMQGMSDADKSFLEQVVLTLQQLQGKFNSHPLTQQFSEDEEDDPVQGAFPRKYVNLVTCLCANYEFMLVTPGSDLAQGLFKLVKDCARAPNLRLSISSLDFWTDFKETIYTCKLTTEQNLLNEFKEISQIMLQQSILIPSVPYGQVQPEEVEELEVQEKGVSIARFREYASDILLTTYLLLQRAYGQQGEQVIYQMLTQALQEGQRLGQASHLEVCFFAARSIYDGFNDEEWNKPTLVFINEFFKFIPNQPQNDFSLLRASLHFSAELAQVLVEMKQEIGPVLAFSCAQVNNERLRTLALNAISGICDFCQTQFTEAEIGPLITFCQQYYDVMSSEHASKLVYSAGTIASVQEDDRLFKAIEEIARIPLQQLLSPESDRLRQIKALHSLRNLINAIKCLPHESLKSSLTALFTQTWPQCQNFLATKANDSELVEANCDYLLEVLQCLPDEVAQIFLQLQETLLRCLVQNPVANCKCLKAYAELCTQMSKHNDQVKMHVLSTVNQVCEMLLPIILKPQVDKPFIDKIDTEVVSAFTIFLVKILELNAEVLVTSPHLPSIMQLLTQSLVYIQEKELAEHLIKFFLSLIEKVNLKLTDSSKLIVMQFYEHTVIAALMSVVPAHRDSTININRVSQALIHIMNQCRNLLKIQDQQIKQIIVNSFDTTHLMKSVPAKIREIVASYLVVFSDQLLKLRLCLQTLCWYTNGDASEDGFLGLELQAAQKVQAKAQAQSNPQQVIQL